jgi:hypothetical protein
VSERAEHLRSFLEGFAQFARLPAPRKVDVECDRFLEGITTSWPALRIEGDVPASKAGVLRLEGRGRRANAKGSAPRV